MAMYIEIRIEDKTVATYGVQRQEILTDKNAIYTYHARNGTPARRDIQVRMAYLVANPQGVEARQSSAFGYCRNRRFVCRRTRVWW